MTKIIDSVEIRVGQVIYDEQPRFLGYDYHPQIVEQVNETTLVVFEESINRRQVVKIERLRRKVITGFETIVF